MEKDTFVLGIAGEKIGVTVFGTAARRYCANYICDAAPTLSVEVTPADVEAERIISAENGAQNNGDDVLLLLALYRKIAERLLDENVLLFHGSALSIDGQAVLFAAKSGTGKSTHARLWREAFGERVRMINDDKPLLKFTEDGILVCGTPWNGKHRLGSDVTVPLKALCILRRARENSIRRISRAEGYVDVLKQIYSPQDPAAAAEVFSLTDKLCGGAELYLLCCNMDQEAAEVAYRGIFEEKEQKG